MALLDLSLVDGDDWNAAAVDALELAINKYHTCTSATRPTGANLYEGVIIYETDTHRRWIYSGSAWVFLDTTSTSNRAGVILTDAAQTIVTATASDITWGTEVSDVDGWTSGGSATLTVPTGWSGRYVVSYSAQWSTSALGTTPGVDLVVNGASVSGANGPGALGAYTVSPCITLAATDTIKCRVYQNSGVSVTVVSRLEIAWLGR
ncbi:MAG: hypothetical protein QOE09_377 [Ilumatobacteraceae bacterium]|jgi:hypothetical protein